MLHNRSGMFLYVWGMENINSMNLKPSDLKIGNLVMFHNETIGYVTGLDVMNIQVNNYYPLLPVKGIPLTGERLIKFGFKLNIDQGDSKDYELEGFNYSVGFDHEDVRLDFITKKGYYCVFYDDPNFQYVHHLQNFHFVLTGKELGL